MEYLPLAIKILLISHIPSDLWYIQNLLSLSNLLNFQMFHANTLDDGLILLSREKPLVLLIEYALPDSQGAESVRRIHSCNPMIPIIFLANQKEEHLAFQMIQEGAEDYLIKEYLQSHALAHTVICTIERHRIRFQVEEQLRKLSRAVEQSPSSIVITNLKGEIEYANPKFSQITGYTIEEAVGQNPRILKSGEMPSESYKQLWDDITSGKEWRGEFHNKRKDGTLFWEMASISPVVDSRGVVTHFVAIKEDITERKRTEEALQRAQEETIAATEAKSAFLAKMSHEIRTPLSAIILMSDVLLDSSLSETERVYVVDSIRICSDGLMNIIDNVLDFSKIEAGRLELASEPFSLRRCIEESLETVGMKAAEKNLDISYEITPYAPTILIGDEGRLRQIIINLLSNAVKFTAQGEIVMHAQLANPPPSLILSPFHNLHLSVRDTGEGLSPEQIARLFQSFQQADATVFRRYGGSGLGLVISKWLVEMMGGKIWVESQKGQGATFHVTIPVQEAPYHDEAEQQKKAMLTNLLATKRVLIVEDNTTIAHQLSRNVMEWGMIPHIATSVSEAVSWFKQGEPVDLAILDLHLPGNAPGFLAHHIRSLQGFQSLPLVLMTYIAIRKDIEWLGDLLQPYVLLPRPIWLSRVSDTLQALFQTKPEPGTTPEQSLSPPAGPLPSVWPGRILVAEDNLFIQRSLRPLLQKAGYVCDVVSNGNEVLQMLEQQLYDIILMDIEMPGMNGFEATHAIRARLGASPPPWIIAMTAHAQSGDRERCLLEGMNDYVSKPIRIEKLTAVLRRAQPKA